MREWGDAGGQGELVTEVVVVPLRCMPGGFPLLLAALAVALLTAVAAAGRC